MQQVELSDFIKNVLDEIANGVRGADAKLKDPEGHRWELFSLRDN